MAVKRKQYKVMQITMNQIADKDGKFIVTEQPKLISNSENLFYDLIYRLQEKSYDGENVENNVFDEFIILKASNLDTSVEENISLYENMMLKGIWHNGSHYIREGAIKSASMTRTQKTLFIRSDLKDKLDRYSSLGKKPVKTIISKMETAKGLLLSSALLLEDCMPNIVIIPDYETTIYRNVNIVEEYQASDEEISEEEKQYQSERAEEKKRWEEVNEAIQQAKDAGIFEKDNLKQLFKRASGEIYTYKSRSRWQNDENRRVKPEEIAKPKRYT